MSDDPIQVLLKALDDLSALLEEEQTLRPMEVTEVLEDDQGEAEAIVVPEWEEDESAALEAGAMALLRGLS